MHVLRFPPRTTGAARLVPSPVAPRLEWKLAWPWLFWACWGIWLAVSDLRDGDVLPAALRLIVGSALLGFARPSRWWLWSLAIAAWVLAEPTLGVMFRMTPGLEKNAGTWFVPPLFSLAGGFLGRTVESGILPRRDS